METCRLFHEAAIPSFYEFLYWPDMTGFSRQCHLIWDDVSVDHRSRRWPRSLEMGSKSRLHAWKTMGERDTISFRLTLPAIATFTNLSSVTISHAFFPLNEICSFVSLLPLLVSLTLRNVHRDWSRNIVASASPTASLESLREITFLDLGGCNPFELDSGFVAVSRLVSLPGLRKLCVSMDTFLDIICALPEVDATFSPTLSSLRVHTVLCEDVDAKLLNTPRIAQLIRRALTSCAPVLRDLHIYTSHSINRTDAILTLPNLVEYIGPHEFLCGLRFASSLKTLWVPASPHKQSTLWRMSTAFVDDVSSFNIQSLRVLRFSVSDTPFESLFFTFRGLKQVGLELATPVSKAR
ncbi:hypothetical protein AAF712_014790 [Marasmius tenuissimus]|uniref:F-box domain-containing protein n=1 Tax=Marasmius tenuissimus TaxID=585030 RepID=A0ABR2ZCA1_9AGAR